MPGIKFQGKNIEYKTEGKGKEVVLLHGYIESLNVWDDFAEKLSENYKVIRIDLPGHGNSDNFGTENSMEIMADSVNAVLKDLKISNCTMIGHSMGGYVTLQFLEKYPEKIDKFCLFHSTPFADNEKKKKERTQIINMIEKGKKVILAKEHVKKTFAEENLKKYVEKIGFLKVIAVNTKNEGTIAALKGMKKRKDFSELFTQTDKPVLWILGKKDDFIPLKVKEKIKLPQKTKIVILENTAHQGFIEEFDKSLIIIKEFIN